MQGTSSHDVADRSTGLTPDAPLASKLQPTIPARVRAMAAALSQQRIMESLSEEEGAVQGRNSDAAEATASDERLGQKRKRTPAAELGVPHSNRQNSMTAAGLPAAPATPPQPKSARMEQMSRSASAEAHVEASTHAEAGTRAAAALVGTPATSAGAGAALAMQAALAKEQQYHADPSEEQQDRADPSEEQQHYAGPLEGLHSPPEGMDAARAWQGQTRHPDAILQEGCAVPDSACMALQVFQALP